MPKQNTQAFYEKVRQEFIKLSEVREDGARLLHKEVILKRLSKKYFRSETTIENIVFHRV